MKSAPGIAFDYAPSRLVSAALCVFAALAATTPWLSALPVVTCTVLSLSAIVAAAMAARSLRSPPFVRIAYRGDGWVLIDRAGVEHAALLRAHRHLGAFVTLDWRCAPRTRFRVVLAPDKPKMSPEMLTTFLSSFAVFTLLCIAFIRARYRLAVLREQANAALAGGAR